MPTLNTDQRIGNYTVKYLIKENHYCETYRVEDAEGTPFFLKLFILKNTPEKLLNEQREVLSITLQRELRHQNIASYVADGIYDSDFSVGRCQWIMTNYFSGELLADKIHREGRLSAATASAVVNGIASALKYLHYKNRQHNDITPRNIMLASDADATPELIDLGHISGYVGGAPKFDTSDLDERYQAPETFAGMYDDRCDIFSLAAVAYTMLTGKAPWEPQWAEGAERKDRVKAVKEARKNPLNLDLLELGDSPEEQGLRRVIERGLQLKNSDRYSKAQELIDDLASPSAAPTNTGQGGGGGHQQAQRPQDLSSSQSDNDTQAQVQVKRGGGNGFEDIAGMEELKEMLRQKVIFILQDKERALKYRLTPPNGMLLYGPPGCGKSFFAEKFAEETGFNFILVKASDLGSIYVHGTQGKIADLFKKAEQGAPTVLCFDEFDAFVPDRSGTGGGDHQAGEVNEFLTQLNNCAKRGIFVIATSNRPDKIDPAVLRTGRIDRQIYVPLPDNEARLKMFDIHLKGRPCEDIDTGKLAALTDGYIASDIAYIVNDAAMGAAFSDRPITQQLLENTIKNIRPSLRKESIQAYDDIRSRMEGINHRNALPHIGFV